MRLKALPALCLSSLFRQQMFMFPVALYWYQQNGLSAADFVFLQGIFMLFGLLFEIPSGYIADNFSKKHILILSYFCFWLRIVLWLSFNGAFIVIIGEILVVLSRSFFQGIYDSYVYEYLDKIKQNKQIVYWCGRVNFCMNVGTGSASLLCSFLYPQYSLYVLLSLEFISTTLALLLLLFLPNIQNKKTSKTIKERFAETASAITSCLTNPKINGYILTSAVFASSTYVLVWNFQPIMKYTLVPAFFFGIVYFCNFMLRAVGSYAAAFIQSHIGDKNLALVVRLHVIFSFLGLIAAAYLQNDVFTLFIIFLICCGIGLQLAFHIVTISKVQKIAAINSRATLSSTNNFVAQGVSGLMLTSGKFLLQDNNYTEVYIIFAVLYVVLFMLLYRLKGSRI